MKSKSAVLQTACDKSCRTQDACECSCVTAAPPLLINSMSVFRSFTEDGYLAQFVFLSLQLHVVSNCEPPSRFKKSS